MDIPRFRWALMAGIVFGQWIHSGGQRARKTCLHVYLAADAEEYFHSMYRQNCWKSKDGVLRTFLKNVILLGRNKAGLFRKEEKENGKEAAVFAVCSKILGDEEEWWNLRIQVTAIICAVSSKAADYWSRIKGSTAG